MKKKTVLITLIYMAVLAIGVALTILVITNKINKDKAYYYLAKVDLEAGTTIDETMINDETSYFIKAETTQNAIKTMESNGSGKVIANLQTLKGRLVTDDIKAGHPITEKNIEPKATTKDNTVLEFKKPSFVELTFQSENILAKRLYKGQRILILADIPMSDAGKDGNYIGALTNYAEVYQVTEAKSGTVVKIVCESEIAVELVAIKDRSAIYIMDNNDNKLDETKAMSSDIIKSISSGVGIYDEFKRNKDLVFFKSTNVALNQLYPSSLLKTEDVEVQETIINSEGNEETITKVESKKVELPLDDIKDLTFLKVDDDYKLSWYGKYAYVWLDHLTPANERGKMTGKYSAYTNDVIYDYRTEINTLSTPLEEGIYVAYFYEKVVKTDEKGDIVSTNFELKEKVAFCIEKEREHFVSLDKMELNLVDSRINSNTIELKQHYLSKLGLKNTAQYEVNFEMLKALILSENKPETAVINSVFDAENKPVEMSVDLTTEVPEKFQNDTLYKSLWSLFNGDLTVGEYMELANNISSFKLSILTSDTSGKDVFMDIDIVFNALNEQ